MFTIFVMTVFIDVRRTPLRTSCSFGLHGGVSHLRSGVECVPCLEDNVVFQKF